MSREYLLQKQAYTRWFRHQTALAKIGISRDPEFLYLYTHMRAGKALLATVSGLFQAMAQAVSRHPELQLMTQELSITTFRYMPSNLRTKPRESGVERHLRRAQP